MEIKTSFENISTTERYVRFVVSIVAIIASIESTVGTGLFAAINIAAIALATTAIVGFDPLKSGVTYAKSLLRAHSAQQPVAHGR